MVLWNWCKGKIKFNELIAGLTMYNSVTQSPRGLHMVMYPVNVRHKGQVMIPASIRDEMGPKEGDRLLVQRRGQEIILVSPEDAVDPTAGACKDYARGKHL